MKVFSVLLISSNLSCNQRSASVRAALRNREPGIAAHLFPLDLNQGETLSPEQEFPVFVQPSTQPFPASDQRFVSHLDSDAAGWLGVFLSLAAYRRPLPAWSSAVSDWHVASAGDQQPGRSQASYDGFGGLDPAPGARHVGACPHYPRPALPAAPAG